MTIDGPTLAGLATVITAIGVLLNTFISGMIAWRVANQGKDISAQGENIQKIETATNSMKDALVKATADASHRAGFDEARKAGELKAAELRNTQPSHPFVQVSQNPPLPVADDRTAIASERVADATERVAAASETKEKKQ